MSRAQEAIEDWYRPVPRAIGRTVTCGLVVVGLFFGGFGTWAATVPLAAAVVSHGTFVATGNNKLVQHLEGGIIQSIMAEEGQKVEKDQLLVVLDETAARTNVRRLLLRIASFEARAARLQVMMLGGRSVDFSHIEADRQDADQVAKIVADQQKVFVAGLAILDAKIGTVEKNRESLESRVDGVKAQLDAVQRQRALIAQELAAKRTLVDKALYRRSDLFAIERAAAEADGVVGKLEGDIGDMQTQMDRLSSQMAQTEDEYRQSAAEDIQGVNSDIDDMREQLLAAQSVLGRTEIRSPVSGTVVKIYYHTTGGVIEGGRQIMEILPSNDKLLVETLIEPNQINNLRIGESAGVRLTSFNQRTTPQLRGIVTYISADTVVDPRPGRAGDVYVARISLGDDQIARIHDVSIAPGMPADVYIETAHRTFVNYLLKPIRDSMSRAFLER